MRRLTLSDAAVAVYREGGPRAFFRGNGANVVKVIPETVWTGELNENPTHFSVHAAHVPSHVITLHCIQSHKI